MTSSGYYLREHLPKISAAIERVENAERQRRRADAEQLAALADAMEAAVGAGPGKQADRELAYRSLRLELATVLHCSEYHAENLLELAHAVGTQYPQTAALLGEGRLSLAHARVIVDEGSVCTTGDAERDRHVRSLYEAAVLPTAVDETPNRLRPLARNAAAGLAAVSLAERHERAVARRDVRVVACDDGMADLVAHLSAEDAYAIHDRLTRVAKASVRDAGVQTPGRKRTEAHDPVGGGAGRQSVAKRSRAELRADVFRDLLLERQGNTSEAAARVHGKIQLVIPARILGGGGIVGGGGLVRSGGAVRDGGRAVRPANEASSDGVAELIGYGPIDAETARGIAARATSWEQLSVDSEGVVLSVDRYEPSAAMKRFLAARDLHCRAPGCRVPAHRCELDHTIPWSEGGETSTANLAHLCKGHHDVKHHTDWEVKQLPGGVMSWTSGTGRERIEKPPSRVRFRNSLETDSGESAPAPAH